MKLITLYIANRLDHVVDFDAEEPQALESYVVERKEIGDPVDLFAFYHSIGNDSASPAIHGKRPKRHDAGTDKEIVFQSNVGRSTLYINKISAHNGQNDGNTICVEVELSTSKSEHDYEESLEETGLSFDTSNQNLWVMRLDLDKKQKEPIIIKITFKLKHTENTTLEQRLQLCVAKKSQVEDIVIDFGSEASQTASYARDEKQTVTNLRSLFKEMKALLSKTPSPTSNADVPTEDNKSASDLNANDGTQATQAGNYVQEDSDPRFFRSVFYAKKSFSDNDTGEQIPELNTDGTIKESEVIKMLTTQNEAQSLLSEKDFIQMPNVKIIQFGGVEPPVVSVDGNDCAIHGYKDGYFYRVSINHFILNALLKAKKPCICLYVLMPNVYSPLSVMKHLRWIREDVKNLIEKNEVLKNKIKGVELSAISESDASLLGAIGIIQDNSTSSVQPGNYIIIDAGKGTLDFSAIRYEISDEGPRIKSVYRSGIIGAGNALTYAYLFALIDEFYTSILKSSAQSDSPKIDNSSLLSYVYDNILGCSAAGKEKGGGELADIIKLMQAVERYKVRIGTKGASADNSIQPSVTPASKLNEIEMKMITEFIDELAPINTLTYKPMSSHAQKIVTKTINQIVNKVYDHLSILKAIGYQRIDGVIFAGRGFCLPDFKKAMMDKLNDLQKLLQEKDCATIKELKYMRPGFVINEKSVCLYIRNAIQKGHYNNHMISVPAKLHFDNSPSYNGTKEDVFSKIQKRLSFWTRSNKSTKTESTRMHQLSEVGNAIFSSRDHQTAIHTPGNIMENGFVDGYTLTLTDIDDIVMIGGALYRIEKRGEVTFFFSNENIFYRYRSNNNWKIEQLDENGVDVHSSPLIFGTLFPNVVVEKMQEVCLPYGFEDDGNDEEESASKDKDKKGKDKVTSLSQQSEGQNSDVAVSPSTPGHGDDSATDTARQLAEKL